MPRTTLSITVRPAAVLGHLIEIGRGGPPFSLEKRTPHSLKACALILRDESGKHLAIEL